MSGRDRRDQKRIGQVRSRTGQDRWGWDKKGQDRIV